jgi:hypothetical protein
VIIYNLWGCLQLQQYFRIIFITITNPLHVSASMGHLQVEYILVRSLALLCYNGSVVLFKLLTVIYIIFVVFFWQFLPVSVCLLFCYIFLHITIINVMMFEFLTG